MGVRATVEHARRCAYLLRALERAVSSGASQIATPSIPLPRRSGTALYTSRKIRFVGIGCGEDRQGWNSRHFLAQLRIRAEEGALSVREDKAAQRPRPDVKELEWWAALTARNPYSCPIQRCPKLNQPTRRTGAHLSAPLLAGGSAPTVIVHVLRGL